MKITDKNEILEKVKRCACSFENASEDCWALQSVGEKFKNNREIVWEAVKTCGEALQFTGEKFKNDIELVLEAVWQNGKALQYAGEEFRKDIKAMKKALLYLKIQTLCGQLRKQEYEVNVKGY